MVKYKDKSELFFPGLIDLMKIFEEDAAVKFVSPGV